ncbi:hypothetical protein SEVIR_3G083432v4 [Setaria viridis]|nr:hypothetical protein SEVIR_3G083432v2 [Setaria viridis]
MVFYDLCQLCFSNRNFFLDDDYIGNTYIIRGSQLVSTPPAEAFDAAVRLLVNATANCPAENSSRRFGTGEEDFDNKSRIYALAQCTPDKTADVCRTCLTTIAYQLPTYFGGFNGGGIFGAWCSFRYELDPFFSGRPLLQLPAFVWTPPPPPPAPALPAITSQDKSRNKTGMVLLAILIPSTIAAMLAISVICLWIRRRRSAAQSVRLYTTSSDGIQGADELLLDLSVLRVAT